MKPPAFQLHVASLLILSAIGCRTPRDTHEIEYLIPTAPHYPVVNINHTSDDQTPPSVAPAVLGAQLELTRIEQESPTDAVNDSQPPQDEFPAPDSAEVGLSLEFLEQLAENYNPTLRQAAAAIQAARGRWLQAGLYPNPTLGYLASEIGNEGQAGQQGGYVGQTIVTGHKLAVDRAVAAQVVDRQFWRYEAQQWRVLNEVALRHAEALGAQRIAELTAKLEAIASEGADVSQRLFESQQVGRADVLQAEIQWNQIRVLRQNAIANELAARRQLANVVGVPELPPQPFVGDLEETTRQIDFNAIWGELVANSPVLMIARADIERARLQQRAEQLRPVPNLELLGSVQRDYATDTTIYGAQMGIALPVFDGNQGNMAAARAEYARATAELERVTLLLRDQLTEAIQRHQVAAAETERYRLDIIPRARENLQLTEEAYRLGEFDFLRVLTARQTFFQTNVEYRRSLIALRQAEIMIGGLLLTGGLTDPEA